MFTLKNKGQDGTTIINQSLQGMAAFQASLKKGIDLVEVEQEQIFHQQARLEERQKTLNKTKALAKESLSNVQLLLPNELVEN